MRAVLLAAGDEPALRPLVFTCCPAMLPLAGVPLLELWVDRLARAGVDEIVIAGGRFADAVRGYFGDGRRHGVPIGHAFEGSLADGRLRPLSLGSAAALARIDAHAGFGSQTTFVARPNFPADVRVDLDLPRAIERHRSSGATASIVSSDAWLLEPEAFDRIPSGPHADIARDWIPRLEAEGLRISRPPLSVEQRTPASLSDYLELCLDAVAGRLPGIEPPGVEIADGVRVGVNVAVDLGRTDIRGPVSIGAGSLIEAGARIVGPCWIGANAVIESGVSISECVVDDDSHLAGPIEVSRRFVRGDHAVNLRGQVEAFRESGQSRRRRGSPGESSEPDSGHRVSEDLLRLAARVAERVTLVSR